jgi:hypothetical protein
MLEISDVDADAPRIENGSVTIDDLRALAVHESGHAVTSQRLGLGVAAIEIDRLDGFTFVADQDRARPNV